jgi:hypothetical protein
MASLLVELFWLFSEKGSGAEGAWLLAPPATGCGLMRWVRAKFLHEGGQARERMVE